MADEVDLANELVELSLKRKLIEIGAKSIPENDTGVCLGCGEPIEGVRRWHNAECRGYWELESRRK
jgi:RNA polymerase-binding transcription factor DksA